MRYEGKTIWKQQSVTRLLNTGGKERGGNEKCGEVEKICKNA